MQLAKRDDIDGYLIAPDPGGAGLTRAVTGTDHLGNATQISVVEERPLTIFLNAQEIVTAMTIGDYPEYLALGFLRNQGMLSETDVVTGFDFDEELETVVVRTKVQTNHEEKLKKKTRTSGCAVGTVFGDMMEGLEGLELPATQVKTSDLYALAAKITSDFAEITSLAAPRLSSTPVARPSSITTFSASPFTTSHRPVLIAGRK